MAKVDTRRRSAVVATTTSRRSLIEDDEGRRRSMLCGKAVVYAPLCSFFLVYPIMTTLRYRMNTSHPLTGPDAVFYQFCGHGERLSPGPLCSRGQDDPSAWRCLNTEIDKVERQLVLCTELLDTSSTMILKGTCVNLSFSTLESGSGKQQFKDLTVLRVLESSNSEYTRVASIMIVLVQGSSRLALRLGLCGCEFRRRADSLIEYSAVLTRVSNMRPE